MVVERNPQEYNRFIFPYARSDIRNHIKTLDVHTGGDKKFAAAIHCTMTIAKVGQIKNMYFAFESGPIVEAGGDFAVPLNPLALLDTGDNVANYTDIGYVVVMYNHPDRHFFIHVDVNVDVLGFKVTGAIRLDQTPKLFGVYVGYPDLLTAGIVIDAGFIKAWSTVGVGYTLQFASQDQGGSFMAAKIAYDMGFEANVLIVYVSGYLQYGMAGELRFDDGGSLELEAWLRGGMKGGINLGKKFDIISFHLDASGKLTYIIPKTKFVLAAHCEVGYSLNLLLFKANGSVSVNFEQALG